MLRMLCLLGLGLTAAAQTNAGAETGSGNLEIQQVTDNVFALVGPLGDRSPENLGNNATYGLIITSEGVVLIDSGGTRNGARRIHESIRSLTTLPVTIVINTNSQDHRWLGNDYFREHGARIIAHRKTVADQKARLNDMLMRLTGTVGEQGMAGTQDAYADEVFEDTREITLGKTTLQLIPAGQAHTPADILVWLPEERVMFTGDIVYTERMLSVRPYSSSRGWMTAFETMEALDPEYIVPGHGHVTTLDKARRDTWDYLRFLRQAVTEILETGGDITETGSLDQSEFSYLENYAALKGRNAQQVFQEMEWE